MYGLPALELPAEWVGSSKKGAKKDEVDVRNPFGTLPRTWVI
jgi:hypothetical protein